MGRGFKLVKRNKDEDGNIVPDFMFNIETWSYQTVRGNKGTMDAFNKLSDLMDASESAPSSLRLAANQALPAIPLKTALDVYTTVLRTLMVPILENREISEKILSNDATLIKEAFAFSDADHQTCVVEAQKSFDRMSLVSQLENQKAIINKVSKEDFASTEQYQTWKQDMEQDVDSRLAKLKAEPNMQAKLIVDVLDATDLAIRDQHSKSSDPYVMLKVKATNERKSKDKEKTKTINKNLNPVWNEKFSFPVRSENSRMKLEVWDSDATLPDFIGQSTILTSSLSPFFPQTHLLTLEPRDAMGKLLKKGRADEKLGSLRVKTQYLIRKPATEKSGPEFLKSFEEAKEMYKILVRMFITEHSPEPSTEVAWVLNNFCATYGIGRIHQKLTILEILSATFQPKKRNIASVKNISNECSKDIFGQRCIARKSEIDLYYQIMDTLKAILENYISKYTYAFPTNGTQLSDEMTLSGTVTLYETVWGVCADNNLRSKRLNFKDNLVAVLERSMETNWEIWKNSEMTNLAIQDGPSGTVGPVTMQMINDDVITITLLQVLCEMVFLQVSHDVRVYAREIPSVNLAQLSVDFYYSKLSGYVSDIFITKPAPASLSTFTIYGKLLEFHKHFEAHMDSIKKLDLQQIFRKYFDQWVSQAAHKLKNWAKSAMSNETWEPIAKEDGTLHTVSVVDIFTSFSQSKHFLLLLGPELKSQYIPFTKVVGNVTEFYGTKLKELALQEIAVEMENAKFETDFALFLQQNAKGVKGGLKDRKLNGLSQHLRYVSLTASPKLCAVLNSLEVSRELLDDFNEEMEQIATDDGPNISQALKPTFTTLKTICDQVDEVLLTKMNRNIMIILRHLFATLPYSHEGDHKAPLMNRCINIIMAQALANPINPNEVNDEEIENHLAFLFWYLDQELEILSSNLYEHVFLRILRQIYVTLIRDMEDIVFPEGAADSYKQEEQALFIEAVLKTHLHPFFFADGQGLTDSFLTKHSQQLLEALALFRTETPKLTALYSTLPKNSLIYEKVSAHQVLSVLASRTGDKRAQEFVQKKYTRSKSRTFKLKFNVTNQIDNIASFSCLQQSPVFSFVQLFITDSLVCWSASLSNYRDVVPLTKILNVKMEDDLALCFVCSDPPQAYYFRSFARQEKLEQAYNTLIAQAKKVGNTKCTEVADATTVVNRMRTRAGTNSGLTGKEKEKEKDKLARQNSTEKLNELLLHNTHHPAVLRQQKENKYRLLFGLPEDEPITHSYMCSLRVASVGKMTIAQHYVCFRSKFPAYKITIPIVDIQVMEKKKTTMFNDAISIKTGTKSYFFSSFQKRDEVFLILNDLWDAVHHDATKSP